MCPKKWLHCATCERHILALVESTTCPKCGSIFDDDMIVRTASGKIINLGDSQDTEPEAPDPMWIIPGLISSSFGKALKKKTPEKQAAVPFDDDVLNTFSTDAASGLAMAMVNMGLDADEAHALVHTTAKVVSGKIQKATTPSTADCFRKIIDEGYVVQRLSGDEIDGFETWELYKLPLAAHITPHRCFRIYTNLDVSFKSCHVSVWRFCTKDIALAIIEALYERYDEQSYEEKSYDEEEQALQKPMEKEWWRLDTETIDMPGLPLRELTDAGPPAWLRPSLRNMIESLPTGFRHNVSLSHGQVTMIANTLMLIENLPSWYSISFDDSPRHDCVVLGSADDFDDLDIGYANLLAPVNLYYDYVRKKALRLVSTTLQNAVYLANIQKSCQYWKINHYEPSVGERMSWAQIAIEDTITWLTEPQSSTPGSVLSPLNLEKHLPHPLPQGLGLVGDMSVTQHEQTATTVLPARYNTDIDAPPLRHQHMPAPKRRQIEIVAAGDTVIYGYKEPIGATEDVPSAPMMVGVDEPDDFE